MKALSYPLLVIKKIFSTDDSFKRKLSFGVSKIPQTETFSPPFKLRNVVFWQISKTEKHVKWKIGCRLDKEQLGKYLLDILYIAQAVFSHLKWIEYLNSPNNWIFLFLHIFHSEHPYKKTAFLNLKVGEKVSVCGNFETQKLDFLLKEPSVEKIFFSQEAAMIKLLFDE